MARHRRLTLLLISVCLLLLGSGGVASAHAMLETTTPAAGSVLARPPVSVVLHFGEDVGVAPQAVRVLDARGHDETGRITSAGHYVTASLTTPLGSGSYLVVWRMVSADSHPVTGSFSFSVGHPGPLAVLHPRRADRVVAGALAGARGVGYLGLAVFAGGVWFGLSCWVGLAWSRRGRRVVAVGWVAALLGAASSLLLEGPYGRGSGMASTLDPAVLRADLTSRYGHAVLGRLVLLCLAAACAVVLRRRHSAPAARLFGAAMLACFATFAWTGHAGVGRLLPLSVLSDVVHLAAMSLWLGGLVQLVLVVLPAVEPRSAAGVAARFSRIAAVSVVALVVSGTFQAWRQLADVAQLWSTGYGRLLAAKTLLVGLVLVAAAFSRRWVMRNGGRVVVSAHVDATAAPRTAFAADVRPLRRAVATEAALLVAVLAVTSFLVSAAPGAHHDGRVGAPMSSLVRR